MRWRFSKLDWGYAVGELIIVTAGVLIALTIDQWNNDRLDRVEEVLLVDRFIVDLQNDLNGISQGFRLTSPKEERLLALYSALSSDRRPTDVAAFLEDVVQSAQYGWNQSRVRRNTFDEVLGSGRFTLIQDGEIRDRIAEYYDTAEGRGNRIEERETDYPNVSYRLVPRSAEFAPDIDLIDADAERIVERAFNSSLRDSVVAELNFARFVLDVFTDWQTECVSLISELETYRSTIE